MVDPSGRVSIHYEISEADNLVRCTVRVSDPELIGRQAELRLRRTVEVHDSRGVNDSDLVTSRQIPSLAAVNEISLHRATVQAYSYSGDHIRISLRSELEVDGLVFDTTITEEEEILLAGKHPVASNDAKGLIEPHDAFDLITNLKAIPPKNRAITLMLLLAGMIVIGINTWIGVHDQFVPESQTWVFAQRDSDGDAESPLQKSLMASGAIGAVIWFAIRKQLRTYMTFEICNLPETIRRADTFAASAVLRGRARVDLHDVHLRIVACNMEKGQYKRGSGTKERTVSFKEPARAVVLYDQTIALIPAGQPVEQYFSGHIPFEPMFSALYPPQRVSSTHGIDVYWEVQLIHDELIDQELEGPIGCFLWQDFLEA